MVLGGVRGPKAVQDIDPAKPVQKLPHPPKLTVDGYEEFEAEKILKSAGDFGSVRGEKNIFPELLLLL